MGSQGFPMTLKKALKITPELNQLERTDPEIKDLIELAKKVEGNTRHISVHACALVIAPEVLTNFTPLQFEPGGGEKIITQYEMHACEDVGLIKLDILGIRNLSILANAIKLVKTLHKKEIDIHQIPLENFGTWVKELSPQSIIKKGKRGSTKITYKLTTFGEAKAKNLLKEILANGKTG